MKFAEYLTLKEDPMVAMRTIRNQMGNGGGGGEGQGMMAKGAGFLAKTALDSVSGGMAGNLIDAVQLASGLMHKKQQSDQSNRIEGQMAEFQGLKIPQGLIDINEKILDALSVKAFSIVMHHTLAELAKMQGKYPPQVKYIFNRKAKEYLMEVFGNVKG